MFFNGRASGRAWVTFESIEVPPIPSPSRPSHDSRPHLPPPAPLSLPSSLPITYPPLLPASGPPPLCLQAEPASHMARGKSLTPRNAMGFLFRGLAKQSRCTSKTSSEGFSPQTLSAHILPSRPPAGVAKARGSVRVDGTGGICVFA